MGMSRREFVRTAALAGAGLLATGPSWAQDLQGAPAKSGGSSANDLRIAIIGAGSQGRFLMTQTLKIPGLRYVAVCDAWPYHQRYGANILKKYDQIVNVYDDYREMLSKEKDLDAVIVATPDWMHAEHANACLNAGAHVYCEKEMSNTVEGARSMVETARKTGKLLQIGHQRRSSPRYWHSIKMIDKDKVLGRITHCYGQWNRAQLLEQGWPKGEEMADDALKRFGYDNMDQFRNWRWYRRFSGGPLADLGSHQIDIFNWILKATPTAVLGSGGLDYYTEQTGRDWYDNAMTIYEYRTALGPVRAFYQVLNTTSYGGFYEQFMGDQGTLQISDDGKTGYVFREVTAKRREWEDEADKIEKLGRDAIELKIGETLASDGKKDPEGQKLLAESMKDSRLLHLENFFRTVRGEDKLNCPAEVGYETAVTVLKANRAIDDGVRVTFESSEFTC
ncbi:MAG: Gfo/Idh/MocA family oxidoreductase [Phycisphaerales bacterium]|nr:Gfo/Idh/MocA family oxidoreductase [Phycisphaerales bacterium]